MAGGGGFVTTGRDVLGSGANENRFGYGAYLRDPAVPQWHVRHRVFRSDLGRWLTRDSAGYVDGLNLYEYAMSMPVLGLDPHGLDTLGGRWIYPEGEPDLSGGTPGGGLDKEDVQLCLDAVGCIDPTPVSDGINFCIYVSDGDYFNALISMAAMFPFIGDVAKAPRMIGNATKIIKSTKRAPKRRGHAQFNL